MANLAHNFSIDCSQNESPPIRKGIGGLPRAFSYSVSGFPLMMTLRLHAERHRFSEALLTGQWLRSVFLV